MVDVHGKWALITGASRGIGYLTGRFGSKTSQGQSEEANHTSRNCSGGNFR